MSRSVRVAPEFGAGARCPYAAVATAACGASVSGMVPDEETQRTVCMTEGFSDCALLLADELRFSLSGRG